MNKNDSLICSAGEILIVELDDRLEFSILRPAVGYGCVNGHSCAIGTVCAGGTGCTGAGDFCVTGDSCE